MWEGIEPDAVKADWEENLREVFSRNPKSIAYALDNLPERVPTADKFLTLCRQAPWPHLAALQAPDEPKDPQRVEAALQAMKETKKALVSKSLAQQCIDGIEAIVHNRDGKISDAQKSMVSHCLRMPGTSTRLSVEVAK